MSAFSEYLDNHMEEHSISSAELAKDTGIDRTTIHRYRKGKRIPADEETVVMIADSLRMRAQEKSELMEKYDRVVLGENTVNGYKYVKDMLHMFAESEKQSDTVSYRWNCSIDNNLNKPVMPLGSENEIVSHIHAVFDDAREKGREVSIIMQPTYNSVMNLIAHMFEHGYMKVNHIICIEQNHSKSYMNLEAFRQILPLSFQNRNYNAMYYYDVLHGHINETSLMPNVVITDECAVLFDYEMQHGMRISNDVYIDVMKQEFKKLRNKATPFVCAEYDQIDVMHSYNLISVAGDFVTLFNQPCMAVGISSDIYEKFLYPFPEKSEFIKLMCDRLGDWQGNAYNTGNSGAIIPGKAYSLVQGIRDFMETGRVNEFPAGFYAPLDMEARRNVLSRMIALAKKGYINYYFLTTEIEMPDTLYFYIDTKEKNLLIHKVYEDRINRVFVQEVGIFHAFMSFFEYLEKKKMLCCGEDIIKVMEDIEREYSEN